MNALPEHVRRALRNDGDRHLAASVGDDEPHALTASDDERLQRAACFRHASSSMRELRPARFSERHKRAAFPPITASRSAAGRACQIVVDERHRPTVVGGHRAHRPVRPDEQPVARRNSRTPRRDTAGCRRASTASSPLRSPAPTACRTPFGNSASSRIPVSHSRISPVANLRLRQMIEHETLTREPRRRARRQPAGVSDK